MEKKDEGVSPNPILSHSTLWPPARWYIQMDSIHLPLGLRIQAGNYYRTNLSFSLLFDQLYFILYSSRFRTSCMSPWEGTGNPNWGIGFSHIPNTPENPTQDYGKETEELTRSSRIFNIPVTSIPGVCNTDFIYFAEVSNNILESIRCADFIFMLLLVVTTHKCLSMQLSTAKRVQKIYWRTNCLKFNFELEQASKYA